MRPSTPLPRPAEMVLDPGPDHLARPDLTRAGILPTLNTEAFLAPARGMAEIGGDLAKTGSAFTELAIKKQQADAIVQEHKADTLRAKTEAGLQAAMQAEPDHNKWPGLLTGAVDKLRTAYDQMPMSGPVREVANAKLDVWREDYGGKLKITIAGRSFDQAGAAIQDKIQYAVSQNDLTTATALSQKGAAAGFWSPDKAQALAKDAEQQIQKNHAQTLAATAYQFANDQPDAFFKAWPARPPQLPENVYDGAVAVAQRATRTRNSEFAGQFLDSFKEGKFKTPADTDEWAARWPQPSPAVATAMRSFVSTQLNPDARNRVQDTAPETASRLESEAAFLDVQADPPERYLALRLESAHLPEPWHSQVTGALEARYRDAPAPQLPPLVAFARDFTLSMLRQGMFGDFTVPSPAAGESSEAAGETALARNDTVRDPAAWETAAGRRAAVDGSYRRWLDLQSRPDEAEAKEALLGFLNDATRSRVFDALMDGTAPSVA